ncbi:MULTISPECIES: hypothetical protein [unclassified Moraxella]|uniref:hypothetical protein n=1 Tax=unclassified Moraxella TaxID=2685852 RepID=UPI003AF6C7AC
MTDISMTLRQEINRCYDVFGKCLRPTQPLNACTCPMCLDPKLEQEMKTLPLAQITAKHFYRYNSSPLNKVQNANEIKYFLPRMIELFVQGEYLHHSTELYFERVGNCPADSFSPKEQAVWQQFADAYLDEMLKVYCWEYSTIYKWHSSIFDVLLMFYKGNIDIQPFLQRWRNTQTPQAIVNYIHESYWDFWCDGGYKNPFADDLPKFREVMDDWLNDESNKGYFIEQILNLDSQVIEEFYAWNGRYGLVENLFDLMTYDLTD